MLKRSLSAVTHTANRFVRFGYRKPPPWSSSPPNFYPLGDTHSTSSPSTVNPNPHDFDQDYSSWPELSNVTIPLVEVPSPQDPSLIPVLAHGTEIVLRGDGVYPLEAPRDFIKQSKKGMNHGKPETAPSIYYDDTLRRIVQPEHIAWQNIPGYIPAAKDSILHDIAASTPDVLYTSSTSSMTPAVTALYHLLSNFRDTDLLGGLSSQISELPCDFSKMHRRPTAFTLSRNRTDKAIYSINAHNGIDVGPSILRDLGHSMERMLTTTPTDFLDKYVLSAKDAHSPSDQQTSPHGRDAQYYNYSKLSRFLLRAQIDCRNERTGEVFDVKTRAVAPIRYDLPNYTSFTSHRLRYLHGKHNSYEREFYDMVRTVFLKYSLQLRIGRMSGALVAYHNTTEVLGLEYIPLEEMHSYIFGGEHWADISFGTAIKLFEEILASVSKAMETDGPDDYIKVVLTTDWSKLRMNIFAQVVKKGESDPFGVQSFSNDDSCSKSNTSNSIDGLAAQGQWHHDSHLHYARYRGISAIGCHDSIKALGGEKVSATKAENQPRRRGVANDQNLNYTKFDFSTMTANRFGVWELNVAPLVNGKFAPKNRIVLEDDDCFTLKYSLQRVESITNTHYANFVTSLGRIYVR